MATTRDFLYKFRRAQSHLDDLNVKVDKWLKDSFRTITHEKHPDRPGYFIAYVDIDAVPIDPLVLLIGDVLHNLRGTLDHLAYTLAEKYSGLPLSYQVAKDSEFPIFGDARSEGISGVEKRYAAPFVAKIGSIDPLAQAIIKKAQPYQRGNKFASHPLWMLQELSNFDKHRLLLTGAVHTFTAMFPQKKRDNFTLGEAIVKEGYLEGKTEIVTYSGWPTDPSKEMHVELIPVIEVVFRCGSAFDGVSVHLTLLEILKQTATIITDLDNFL